MLTEVRLMARQAGGEGEIEQTIEAIHKTKILFPLQRGKELTHNLFSDAPLHRGRGRKKKKTFAFNFNILKAFPTLTYAQALINN